MGVLPQLDMQEVPQGDDRGGGEHGGQQGNLPHQPNYDSGSRQKTKSGKTFGTMAMSPIRADRNMAAMRTKITPALSARLQICPLTISPVVRVRRIKLPVGWTVSSGGKCPWANDSIWSTRAAMSLEREREVRTKMIVRV